MSNHASKSILARALAQENITVEHRPNVQTACFDVANRVLILPVWKNMSEELHDMFVGHEVGHALYTPYREKDRESQGNWFKDAEEIGGTMNAPFVQDIINVVEDARIERLMKEKFPGLRRDFVVGYNELLDRDFFGTKSNDIASMEFPDRMNLHTKCGVGSGIPFSDSELELIRLVENTQSFDDVLSVTKKIFDYMNGQHGDMPKSNENGATPVDLKMDKDGDQDAETGAESNQSDNADNTQTIPTNGSEPKNKQMPKMKTQENFDNASKNLVDTSTRTVAYHVLPNPNLDRIIYPFTEVLKDMKEHFDHRKIAYPTIMRSIENKYADLQKKINPLVGTLIKQFEMRKAADVSKRTSISRTGKIDCDRIFKYKVSDDIFLRNAVIAEGKNHGLVMFVDWSASMGPVTEDVVEQIVMLASFCRRVGIPFDVYLFTTMTSILRKHLGMSDEYPYASEYKQWSGGKMKIHRDRTQYDDDKLTDERDTTGESFALVNFLSSSMTSRQFNDALKYFYFCGCGISDHRIDVPRNYCQSNTPLDSTILAAMKIVPQFREKHKVQIVNTIFLTDGQTSFSYFYGTHYDKTKNFVQTPYSKKVYEVETGSEPTTTMLKMFRDVTQSNAIGFFIINRGSCHYFKTDEDRKKFKNNNFFEVNPTAKYSRYNTETYKYDESVYDVHGYNRLYVLPSNTDIIDVEDEMKTLDGNATLTRIRSTFIKSVNKHNVSRNFLNRFADVIAVA